MTLTGGTARLDLAVIPAASASAAPVNIRANLFCISQAVAPTCVGISQVSRSKVLVTTVGTPGDGPVVIRFSDAVTAQPFGDRLAH
jgi:hypothetical protein